MKLMSVIKPLFEIRKHMELVSPAALILKNDGKTEIYNFLSRVDEATGKTGLAILAKGAGDADKPLSGGYIITLWHFHHPWTHRGYLTGHSSAVHTAELYALALKLWRDGKREQALYQLGRALHLLQDIFIPQHAAVTAIKGHSQLEKWLTGYWEPCRVTRGGYYHWEASFRHVQHKPHHVCSDRIYDWIDHGSHLSIDWFDRYFAGGNFNEDTFKEAARLIIPHALRFSAGFIYKFFCDAGL